MGRRPVMVAAGDNGDRRSVWRADGPIRL